MIGFLFRAFRALLVMLWIPTAAVASQITFGQAMRSITVFEWGLLFLFSTLGGGTALLMKFSAYVNSFPAGVPVPPMRAVWLLSTTHMLASWLAGLFCFFMTSQQGLDGLYVALLVPLGAFGGAKTLEYFWTRTFGKIA